MSVPKVSLILEPPPQKLHSLHCLPSQAELELPTPIPSVAKSVVGPLTIGPSSVSIVSSRPASPPESSASAREEEEAECQTEQEGESFSAGPPFFPPAGPTDAAAAAALMPALLSLQRSLRVLPHGGLWSGLLC